MTARLTTAAVILLLTAVALPAEETKAEAKAREALQKKLAEWKVAKAEPAIIQDENLRKGFTHTFFVLNFPKYPVARLPAEPLKSNNLFAVDGDGKVEHLTDAAALSKFFQANQQPLMAADFPVIYLKSWLRLSQEFQQDGYYKFEIPKDSIKTVSTDDVPASHIKVSGKAVVDPKGGDKGEISVTMEFKKGKLSEIKEEVKLTPGMRPRCQALKLLDPDPVVRYLAEQSLVIMGQSCKPYLDEQRAKASPELQKAIDRVWQRILDEGR